MSHPQPLSRNNSSPGQDGPLAVFAFNLAEVEQDYLWALNERLRLEEQFAVGLNLLMQRTRAIDSGVDSLGYNNSKHSLPSVRNAWRQVRENTEQEVEARRAFAFNLREEVIKPLSALKATQTRIANRIAQDVKDSHDRYNEQAAALSRLQKTYVKKTAEYVDTIAPNSLSSGSSSHQINLSTSTSTRPVALFQTPTTSSSTSPVSAGDQRREDLARGIEQTKKGLNQFIFNLRGDKDRGGGGNAEEREREEKDTRERVEQREREGKEKEREKAEAGTMRGVRLKREAEEADANYRSGVFHLESLRINLERVSQGGSNSAQDFVQELVLTLQSTLAKFAIGLQATSMFAFQMGKRSEEAVEKIDLSRDVQASILALAGTRERPLKPVPYNNFFVGPCKDLIFGVSLQDYAFARGIIGATNKIPILVEKCIKAIEERGLDAEGLYRISPRLATVQNLIHKIEIDEEQFEFARTEEIYTIAAILKLYLRRLPEPLFRWSLAERVAFTKDRDEHIQNGFLVLRAKLKRLPPIHVATLKALVEHLSMVVLADNKMDARNLSIIFSSIIFGENDINDVNTLAMMQMAKESCFEDLLIYGSVIFSDQPQLPSSPFDPAPDLSLLGDTANLASVSVARSRSGSLSNALAQQKQQTTASRSRSSSIASPTFPLPPSLPLLLPSNDFAPAPQSMAHSGSIHQNMHRRKISLRNEQEAAGLAAGTTPSSPSSPGSFGSPRSSSGSPAPPPVLPPRPATAAEGPMSPPPLPSRAGSLIRKNAVGAGGGGGKSGGSSSQEDEIQTTTVTAAAPKPLEPIVSFSQSQPEPSPPTSATSTSAPSLPSPGLDRLVQNAGVVEAKLESEEKMDSQKKADEVEGEGEVSVVDRPGKGKEREVMEE